MKKWYPLILLCISAAAHAQPGSLDSSFDKDGKVQSGFGAGENSNAIVLQKNGKVVVAGSTSLNGNKCVIARYNKNGSIDSTFASGGKLIFGAGKSFSGFYDVALQSDEKIIAAGYANLGGNYNQSILFRFKSNGKIDSSFGKNGMAYLNIQHFSTIAQSVAIQADDKIVIASSVSYPNQLVLSRFTANGKLDSDFFQQGTYLISLGSVTKPAAVEVMPNGKLLLAATATIDEGTQLEHAGMAVLRFTANGKPDFGFGNGGKTFIDVGVNGDAADIKAYPNGKIIIAGSAQTDSFFNMVTVRLTINGIIDSAFGSYGKSYIDFGESDEARALALQADGKIIVAGSALDVGGTYKLSLAMARLKPNGLPDYGFGTYARVKTAFPSKGGFAAAVLVQPDGKILAGGSLINGQDAYSNMLLARYHGDDVQNFVQQKQAPKPVIKIYPNPVKNILVIQNLLH